MDINSIIEIHTFDDGNQRFKLYNNKWIIKEFKYNKSKAKLCNFDDNNIIINSISTWKLKYNNII
jgi:hypothetical protein